MILRYGVINNKGELLSKPYIRKGDAINELKRWHNNSDKSVGTFELILKEVEK
ncbi:hypothetical protein PSYJYH_000016 [Bacillus phage PSYJ-YH]|nr:hypothetical protein PSYJYH_000016 [Bacillus phage PSYJ-YH]